MGSKSCQVHFWVDAALTRKFRETARRNGDAIPDAHRRAMRHYIDQESSEGTAFTAEVSFVAAGKRVVARVFTSGKDETVIRLTGVPIRRLLALAEEVKRLQLP
jgi:hypothetical protein